MLADHLDTRLNGTDYEMTPTRNGYGEGLLEAGKRDERVVALAADLTESTRTHHFAEAFPERFVQVGVAEQNLASVGSGMAAMGKIPFIASYAIFSPGRNWEQIRTTIAYNEANVKIIGAHAGVSVGPDGATHQAIEDIALMRVLPGMVVIAPADIHEARKAVLAAAKHDGPVYIRLGRAPSPVITTLESPFAIGTAEYLYNTQLESDRTLGIVVTGSLAFNAIQAAQTLERKGIATSVLHMPTVKPLDTAALDALSERVQGMVTLEEHQRAGGLGSAVAEHVSATNPTRITRLGVDDQFGQSGTPEELLEHYGMGVDAIVAAGQETV